LASALAQAMAAREESNRKLAELQKRQAELQTASMVNWSDKLAMFKNISTEFEPLEMDIPSTQPIDIPEPETAISDSVSNLEL
jgi:hypothetical protein